MNRDLLSKIVIFAAGAGIGSAVTWKLLKLKYEQIAQEEIESVREVYANRYVEIPDETAFEESEDEDEYEQLIQDSGYVTESTEKIVEEEEETMGEPYVITPEEFGDSDYATVSLWYYTDGVVVNDDGKIVENTEELIGKDFADHFGDYEEDPDAVYVRNDDMEIDYEILMDYRPYSEIN